jgi:prephenate dehydrogenase
MARWKKLAVFGPGLLGGSILLAARERNLASELAVWARRPEALDEVAQRVPGCLTTCDAAAAARGADLVVLCTPVGAMADVTRALRPALSPGTLVTDVGSVKGSVETALAPLLHGRARWIGSHPMAGGEMQGISAARASLFEGSTVVVTPTGSTPPDSRDEAASFWEQTGARVIDLDPATHDRLVAEISHLPHLMAALLVGVSSPASRGLAGGGFRDTTRVAAGSPKMWREIFEQNREATLAALDRLLEGAGHARRLLSEHRGGELEALLASAAEIRQSLRFSHHE